MCYHELYDQIAKHRGHRYTIEGKRLLSRIESGSCKENKDPFQWHVVANHVAAMWTQAYGKLELGSLSVEAQFLDMLERQLKSSDDGCVGDKVVLLY